MEVKRRVAERPPRPPPGGSAGGRRFRRVLYGAIGVILSSYVVLFILVVSRHIDQGAREELRGALEGAEGLRGAAGPGLLGMERLHERWAAVARVLAADAPAPRVRRRRTHACTQPRFRRPPGPMAALASFPGSGNTWIRFLVQQATGVLTGSVYRDHSLRRNGFPAESVANGSVLLVKTHEWGAAARRRFRRAVLLVREPEGALVAEFHRRAGGHVGHAAPDKFRRGDAWQNFVLSHSKLWMESILDWLQFKGPLLVLRYEVITADLPGELIKLLKFLEANVTWNTFQCVLRNRDGIFRRAQKRLGFELFDEPLKQVLDSYKSIVDLALQYHEQGVKFDLSNVTLLQSSQANLAPMNANMSVLPVTYVEKEQSENPS